MSTMRILFLGSLWAWGLGHARAQESAAREEGPGADLAAPVRPGSSEAPSAPKEEEFPKFEMVAKDHQAILTQEGEAPFFPLYYAKKEDELLMVVPRGMLDKDFLISVSMAGGPQVAGSMWDSRVARWREMGKKLVLIEPDYRYSSGKGNEVADAIERTYTDRIILSTPITSKRGADPVINLNAVLKRDFVGAGRAFGGTMDASLSRWTKYKGFPDNVEIAVQGAFMREGQGTLGEIHYSIIKLPADGYKPREADDRIGYFLTAVKDWSAPHDADTVFHRYIHRWRMRKAEPKEDVSDVHPDDQLVYYIEKTVPVNLRRHVREGILEWNKAFEKAGLRNAIQVRQQTDANEFKDIDPEDVRYHFFRWIVSGRAFARGPSIVNPLTGQILDADIVFDDSFIRSLETQYARLSAAGPAADHDPRLEEFLRRHPEWNFQPLYERLMPGRVSYGGMPEPHVIEPPVSRTFDAATCDYARGMTHEMTFQRALFEATGQGGRSEEYVGQILKEVVMHEVGHTLGLRHNFKSSSWKPMVDILANDAADTPTSGSVMDYIGGQFSLDRKDQTLFITPTVGPYDEWAIAYGYAAPDGKTHKDEKSLLKSITDRVAQAGLDYATDEDASVLAPDPLVNRYDHGADVLEYAKHRMDLVKKLQSDILDWAVEEGESYNRLRKTFDMLLFEYNRVAQFAARYVGGQSIHRDHKGDPDARPPIVIVPATKQREALAFLRDHVLSDHAFRFAPEVINRLAPGRWSHWDSDALDTQLDYPLHDRVAAIQHWALFYLMNPVTLGRVYDAELKLPAQEDALTVPELMTTVTQAVWSELDQAIEAGAHANRRPFISSLRRNLQRTYLRQMINVVLQEPGQGMPADVHAVARMTLDRLAEGLSQLINGHGSDHLDAMTMAHLRDAHNRIVKALEAEQRL